MFAQASFPAVSYWATNTLSVSSSGAPIGGATPSKSKLTRPWSRPATVMPPPGFAAPAAIANSSLP